MYPDVSFSMPLSFEYPFISSANGSRPVHCALPDSFLLRGGLITLWVPLSLPPRFSPPGVSFFFPPP